MSKKESSSGISVSFCGLLTIAFIVLKLTGYIDWSWWWVTAPTWIPIPLVLILALIVGYYEAKAEIIREAQEAERRRSSPSKFQQRLQEAIDASEKTRKAKDN